MTGLGKKKKKKNELCMFWTQINKEKSFVL